MIMLLSHTLILIRYVFFIWSIPWSLKSLVLWLTSSSLFSDSFLCLCVVYLMCKKELLTCLKLMFVVLVTLKSRFYISTTLKVPVNFDLLKFDCHLLWKNGWCPMQREGNLCYMVLALGGSWWWAGPFEENLIVYDKN